MATIVWEKSRRQQASARTTQGASTQDTFTATSRSACATFGLGSVLISKLLYYDFKEVSQSDSYYEWVLLADGRRRPDWWIYVKWLFSGCSLAVLWVSGAARSTVLLDASPHVVNSPVTGFHVWQTYWHSGKWAFCSLTQSQFHHCVSSTDIEPRNI